MLSLEWLFSRDQTPRIVFNTVHKFFFGKRNYDWMKMRITVTSLGITEWIAIIVEPFTRQFNGPTMPWISITIDAVWKQTHKASTRLHFGYAQFSVKCAEQWASGLTAALCIARPVANRLCNNTHRNTLCANWMEWCQCSWKNWMSHTWTHSKVKRWKFEHFSFPRLNRTLFSWCPL